MLGLSLGIPSKVDRRNEGPAIMNDLPRPHQLTPLSSAKQGGVQETLANENCSDSEGLETALIHFVPYEASLASIILLVVVDHESAA